MSKASIVRRVADIYASAAHYKFASKKKMILSHPDIAQAGYAGSAMMYSETLREQEREFASADPFFLGFIMAVQLHRKDTVVDFWALATSET